MIPLKREEYRLFKHLLDIEERGHLPPSIRDIMDALGTLSSSTVHYRLKRLQNLGYIDWEPGKNRTIRVAPQIRQRGRCTNCGAICTECVRR